MKRILVPSDFSENARNAFDFAFKLFGGNEAVFVILNTYEIPSAGAGSMMVSLEEILEKESVKGLKEEEKFLREKYDLQNVFFENCRGSVEDGIDRMIDKHNVEMVVMGTQGASGLKKVLIGSNAQKVISESPISVLAIPENSRYKDLKNIVLAANLKDEKCENSLQVLLEIASKTNAEIEALHVATEKEPETETQLKAQVTDKVLSTVKHRFTVIKNENIIEAVNDHVEFKDADMLVVIPRKLGFFENLFSRSVSKKLAYTSKVPLLALK